MLVSSDNKDFTSVGFFNFGVRWKDVPINYMLPDQEKLTAYNFELIAPKPVEARYVKYKITPAHGSLSITEVQVLDSVKYDDFDINIALPDGKDRSDITQYNPKHYPSTPFKLAKPDGGE